MTTVRKATERGHFDFGWLDTHHSFSFGEYVDPRHMGFRSLRVINEDRVQPGQGFGTHGHRDMEIVTLVLDGALEHRDSLGNGSVIRPGDVQRMSAGKGILHSEFNHSREQPLHFLQIWIVPERKGLEPGYEQKHVQVVEGSRLRVLASRDGRDGSVTVHQDADLLAAKLAKGSRAVHVIRPGRAAWIQLVRGSVAVDGHSLGAGDAIAIEDAKELAIEARDDSHLIVFDLA